VALSLRGATPPPETGALPRANGSPGRTTKESAMNIRPEDIANALVTMTFAVASVAMWVVVFVAA